MKEFNKEKYYPFVVLFLLLLIFFPCVFLGKTLYYRDLSIQDFPLITYSMELLRKGEFPFWNPYLFSGTPQFATIQPPIFYPTTIFFLLLPFHLGLTLSLLVHYFLAGLGVYLIGKHWKLTPVACLFGAITFALNGYMFEVNNLEYMVYPITWIPFIFLFTEKIIEESNSKNTYSLILFLALQLATARLDYFYFTFLFMFLWFTLKYFFYKRSEFKIPTLSLGFIFLSSITSLLLLAVQIIPSMEYVRDSFRGEALSLKGATFFSLNPFQVINIFFNNFFGDIIFSQGLDVLITDREHLSFFVYNLYLGIPSILFFFYSFTLKNDDSKFKNLIYIAGIIFTIFLFISFGNYTPIFSILFNYLPGFNFLRYPIKLFIFAILPFCFIIMLAFDKFYKSDNTKAFTIITYSFTTVLLASYITIQTTKNSIINYINTNLAAFGITLSNIDFIFKSILFSLVISLVLSALIFFYQREKFSKNSLAIFIMALLSYELLNNNISNLIITDSSKLYEKTELVQDLEKNLLPEEKALYYMVVDTEGTLPIMPNNSNKALVSFEFGKNNLRDNFSLTNSIYNAFGYSPSPPLSLFKLITWLNDEIPSIQITDEKKAQLMKLMGIKYYIFSTNNIMVKKPNPNYMKLIKEYSNLGIQLWEVLEPQTRFSFKRKIIFKEKEMTLIKTMLGILEPNLDITKDVVFSNDKVLETSIKSKTDISSLAKAKITLVEEINDRLFLDVNNEEDGFLVLAKNFEKNWEAYDNDKKIELLKVNFYQQAIKLEKGQHKIKFLYKPYSFFIGSIISLITLLLLLLSKFFIPFRKFSKE